MEKYLGAIDSTTPGPFIPLIVGSPIFQNIVSLFFTDRRVIIANVGHDPEREYLQFPVNTFVVFLNKAATQSVLKNKVSPEKLLSSNDKNLSIEYNEIQKIIASCTNRFGIYKISFVTSKENHDYYLLNARTPDDTVIKQYLGIIRKALPNTELIQKAPHNTNTSFIIISSLLAIAIGLLFLLLLLLL